MGAVAEWDAISELAQTLEWVLAEALEWVSR